MATIILNKENILEVLPVILEKVKEGVKIQIQILGNEGKFDRKLQNLLNYISSNDWMEEEDIKFIEEFQEKKGELPYKKVFSSLEQDREIFREIFKDMYIN
jgi:hypothetical protein